MVVFVDMLEPRSKGAKPAGENKIASGRGTLRLRSKGPATVEEVVSVTDSSHCSRHLFRHHIFISADLNCLVCSQPSLRRRR